MAHNGDMQRMHRFALPFLLLSCAAIAAAQSKSNLVYITEKGKKYHQKNCRLKQGSKGVTLAEAKKKGYTPCVVCKPKK